MAQSRVLAEPVRTVPDNRTTAEVAITGQFIATAIIAEEVIGLDVLEDGTQRRRP